MRGELQTDICTSEVRVQSLEYHVAVRSVELELVQSEVTRLEEAIAIVQHELSTAQWQLPQLKLIVTSIAP